jgi:hypothetical protein
MYMEQISLPAEIISIKVLLFSVCSWSDAWSHGTLTKQHLVSINEYTCAIKFQACRPSALIYAIDRQD